MHPGACYPFAVLLLLHLPGRPVAHMPPELQLLPLRSPRQQPASKTFTQTPAIIASTCASASYTKGTMRTRDIVAVASGVIRQSRNLTHPQQLIRICSCGGSLPGASALDERQAASLPAALY
ncbi:hypothetical protein Vafri_3665 [Volvox africanus]|uniref:Secreted protein n=1 Tax=Volvox africanus TaxID=51714 RepID=A0A8J4AUU5_9CHLO|nr:hypothetical protein Vafri_3665 [Volvox africanus]